MKKYFFLFCAIMNFISNAQNAGDVVQNFGSFPGFDAMIDDIVIQNDDKIIVCGGFGSYNGIYENHITRLNPDGSKDASFSVGNGSNFNVSVIALQPDGKILAGGPFTAFNGITENRIIRLNSDGTKDSSFNSGTGFNNNVTTIALQSDGKILVGGLFSSYDGENEMAIVRLNSDGSKDNSFYLGSSFSGYNSNVSNIKIQSDGKILVGGNFSTFDGLSASKIIRLNSDGSRDNTFNIGTGFDYNVTCITIQSDGKILVGGNFNIYNGATANKIIRLNTNGTKDTTFNTGIAFNNSVKTIVEQSDGKIFVGGHFTSYNGVTENRIIRLNSNGTKDLSFNSGIGFSSFVNSIAIQSDGKIFAGGYFNIYNSTSQYYLIRLNSDGTKDINFNKAGFNNIVYEIEFQSDGKILAGGIFSNYNAITENKIIRLNPDGTKDISFNSGMGFNAEVREIEVQSDGKILVGGYFTTYDGIAANKIIRLNSDGSRDNTFNIGTGFNSNVFSLVLQSDGKILVGGDFTIYNGVNSKRIIRLNNNGTIDNSFNIGTGLSSVVRDIKVQTDGKIVIGGDFTLYNSTWASKIIRLNSDGSLDTTFDLGTGNNFSGSIFCIGIQSDGKIVVGGNFSTFNGENANKIIRLNSDGTKDLTFNIGTGFSHQIYSIAIQSDGKIVVGGFFTTYNGVTANGIIRLNSDGTNDIGFETGNGFEVNSSLFGNPSIHKIAIQVDGRVFVAGKFTKFKENGSSAFLIGLNGNDVLSNDYFTIPKQISIWPNPTNKIINVNLLNNTILSSVKIYDLQGNLVSNSKEKSINVSNLSSGLYIIRVITDEGEFVDKFIKK